MKTTNWLETLRELADLRESLKKEIRQCELNKTDAGKLIYHDAEYWENQRKASQADLKETTKRYNLILEKLKIR